MDWSNIGYLLGGGIFTGVLTFFINKKKEDRTDFDAIVKVLKEDNERLREGRQDDHERIIVLEESVLKLKGVVLELKAEISRLNSAA